MQYILTEEEFSNLKKKRDDAKTSDKMVLQKFCTMVANTLPFKWGWDKDEEAKPWGCILTEGSEDWHCDSCPSLKVCPYEWKSFSK